MGQYYIKTSKGVFYEFDSTSELSVSLSGKVSEFPLESGVSVSDQYVNLNTTISLNGTISSIKVRTLQEVLDDAGLPRYKSPEVFIQGIYALKTSGEPFTLHYSNRLNPLDDCVFESVRLSQNASRGFTEQFQSYSMSFTLKQVRFGERAQRVVVPSDEFVGAFQDKSTSSGITEEPPLNARSRAQSGKDKISLGSVYLGGG